MVCEKFLYFKSGGVQKIIQYIPRCCLVNCVLKHKKMRGVYENVLALGGKSMEIFSNRWGGV